jgi:hypothetical protein
MLELTEAWKLEAGPKKAPVVNGRKAAKEAKIAAAPAPIEIPENIRKYLDYTLREIIAEFGSGQAFVDFLSAGQKIEAIEEKRIKNAKERGELVHRDLIRIGVLEPVDTAHKRMLTDGARTISQRIISLHESGSNAKELEEFVTDQVASFIRPMKAKIKNTMKTVEAT